MVKYSYMAYGVPSSVLGEDLSNQEIIIANILKNYNIYLYKGYCYDYKAGLYYHN